VATPAEVVAAVDHVLRYKPDWRGTLNDADFNALNEMYQRAKHHPEEWLIDRDLPIELNDKYLGALRLDNPNLFDGGRLVDPSGQPPATQPAGVPPGQTPPGQTPAPADDGFSGKAAEASKLVDDGLAKNKTALNQADEELVDAVLGAKTGSEEGKAQLQALQNGLVDQIHKLGPTLDTPAGQQQLNDYLQGKTQEILGIVKSSGMDAQSKAEVLDALSQRYDAVKDSGGSGAGSSDPAAAGGSGQTSGGTTGSASGSADPGGASPALPSDPLLNGLASDPLMGGLGGLAGPAMGALSGLPGAMGSMMPGMGGLGGGGGMPLGDLGGAIGGAIKEATAHPQDPAAAREADALAKGKDGAESGTASDGQSHDDAAAKDDKSDPAKDTAAAKPGDGEQPQPVAAQAGQVPPAQPGPDVSVKLPDGSTVVADSPQLAHVGRLVLGGASVDDAAGQAQVSLLPAGAPVTEPVSPSQLRFGDYAQFTDHRVMALGGGKVWSEGQVTAADQMPTGPNFLGWARPQVQTAPATVLAGAH
jgi:hypothetical protein